MKRAPRLDVCGFCSTGNHAWCRSTLRLPNDGEWTCSCDHEVDHRAIVDPRPARAVNDPTSCKRCGDKLPPRTGPGRPRRFCETCKPSKVAA